ncbi:MAG: DUF5618 family protein [Bacteroidota bacterium]|nr:DUF5618 family protein [Bacteroidota bacterium]
MKKDTNNVTQEAFRYVENAQDILSTKAGKDDEFYVDKKYVRMAGNTLWNGVLEALNYRYPDLLKSKGRPDINKYKELVSKENKKMLNHLITGYNYMHLYMGYDGDLSFQTSRIAIDEAKKLINWATEK